MSNDNKPTAAQGEIPESVLDAVAAAIGSGVYYCNRTWSAWSYGTMGPGDFHPVADDGDHVAEIAQAAINAITAALRAAPEWLPIDTAPKDDRVLVRCESSSVYAAHWVQNPVTGDEAWLVCALEDGAQMLVHPAEWMPLPAAVRPQGVK